MSRMSLIEGISGSPVFFFLRLDPFLLFLDFLEGDAEAVTIIYVACILALAGEVGC